MAKMSKIFPDSEEKLLMGVVLHYKAADGLLYINKVSSTYSNPISKADLINLFRKGLLIVDNGTSEIRPTTLTISDDYAAVSHTTVGNSNIAVSTSYYSDGYESD